MLKLCSSFLALTLLLIGTGGNAPADPTRTMRGVVVPREDPEQIKMWGEECSLYCAVSPTVRGSSSLKPSNGAKYGAAQGHDMDLSTAWVEGASDSGIGQWIEYTFSTMDMKESQLALTELIVFNGYRKNRDLWAKNGRIKSLTMTVNSKPYGTVELADAFRHQKVKIGSIPLRGRTRTTIRFTIAAVYPGNKYTDTALTELEFEGTGHH